MSAPAADEWVVLLAGPRDLEMEVLVPRTERRLLLDVVLRSPAERLRIDPDRFDHAGLGGAMEPTTLANTRVLAERIVASAPAAHRNGAADRLLSRKGPGAPGYRSLDEYERELRWLITVLPR